ncbi:serine protease filzig [Eupeodes corollae]|uniref:serine protease filzig n=1 Tax=Eupeodes corollae TaxID=290404 RepID=UPI0024907583|nr:serine protease filzig [Eupeodes corollae]
MLFVKLKTFHKKNNNNNNYTSRRKMPATAVKWVNLTALCVLLTVVLLPLPSPANGFTPIGGGSGSSGGGGFRNGEGRKLFGGYRITPKHCRGTKTLSASDPRSTGPTICMFNHECAQRNGEVVGACMDGFLFGACCQVPLSNAYQNTLIQDAQNPNYQSSAAITHSTEGYDSDLYGGNQKFESDEFQEIQSSSSKLHDPLPTESSYMDELVSQKIQKINMTSGSSSSPTSGNKVFYVNKGSVMVSSPSSVSNGDDYIILSSSQSPYGNGNNGVSFTTELPTKISTESMDNEDSTQVPMIMSETVHNKKNYSSGSLDLDMGEFTHSDITHPGAESVLIDSDLQFSTGYGGPQSVYVPPPAHAEIIPPRRKPSPISGQTTGGQNKKPTNDKYVLIQTLEASKKPSQGAGTTSTGISTNIDSIESIILMLNGTNHGPTYNVANTSPSFNQASYGQNSGYGVTHGPYVKVTTARPIVSVTTGSGVVLSDHVSTSTSETSYYEELDPTTSSFSDTSDESNNKYHSIEMSDENPSFVEISAAPQKQTTSSKIEARPPVGPPQNSYNTNSQEVNDYDSNNHNSHHADAANPNYGYTSPEQPTSDFNKMPAVGEAYPVMDDETSAYFETSMLSQEEAMNQNVNKVQAQHSKPPQEVIVQSQGGYYGDNNLSKKPQTQSVLQPQSSMSTHQRPSSQIPNDQPIKQQAHIQNYQEVTHSRPTSYQSSTQSYEQTSTQVPSRSPPQNYEQISQNGPSSQRPVQDYEKISQTGYISHPTPSHSHVRPTSQILTTKYEIQSTTHRPSSTARPTEKLVVTQAYDVKEQNSHSTSRPSQQQFDDDDSQDNQNGYGQVRPTQSTGQQQQNPPAQPEKEVTPTPESQLIAQLTDRIKNGYLANSRPTNQNQNIDQDQYLPRPTPQSGSAQAGFLDNSNYQSTGRPVAVAFDQNGNIQAQAGYFSQAPSFEKIEGPSRPSQTPVLRPKPEKVTYADVETFSQTTISSTSRPVTVHSTKRPTKRVTKRPTTPKKPTTNKLSTQTHSSQSGLPPSQDKNHDATKPSNQKQPLSTSYVTGPTTPRPDIDLSLVQSSPTSNNQLADKVDSYISSTQGPVYSSIYLSSPTDEIIIQNGPVGSINQNYNKPLFVKIPSATQKTPSPTIVITPKPTVVNLITASSSPYRPNTTPVPSNSYIYSPLVTRRPEYSSSTQEYISIPQVTSNEFDDPGYSGLHTPTTPGSNKIPSDDRPAFPGYYGPTPSYPTFELPSDKYGNINEEEEETYTSPNDFVNFPPVRNPNLNMSATSSSVTNDLELSTPAFVEDTILKDKMNTLVHKIVESLQDNFEALADMIDENNNTIAGFSETTAVPTTLVTRRPASKAPTRKPTSKPSSAAGPTRVSTKKPPTRISTAAPSTTRKPAAVTTRKPVATTRKPTTKKPVTKKPTRRVTAPPTTPQPIRDELVEDEDEVLTNEVDDNIGEETNVAGGGGGGGRKFQCGVRPHIKSGRIVGGKGATFGEFPWQVLVRESTWLGLFTKNKCGGVLISNKYVVTAAHCQPGFLASLVAVMGEHDISGDLESKRSVTKNVKRVIVHRQYDAATFENDLALLELESPVNYDTHIVPICMPADSADFTGRMATVTGWGRLKYGGGVPSVLQEVQVPIIENSVCQEMFNTAGHEKKILKSFLCAGYANGQKDSCEGDSGGPLVLQRADGRYELAGTVSHGIRCANPYLPGVYMRTTYYKPWLRSITGVK